MNRNRILITALAACNVLKAILLLLFGIYTVIFIHWHVNPDFYEHVKIGDTIVKNTSSLSMERVSFTFSDISASKTKPDTDKVFTLGNLGLFSFYLFFVQIISYILLSFCIIKEIQKIIQSVQAFDSFRIHNVDSFRKIGLYSLLFFVATSFLFAQTPEGEFLGLYFNFLPLCFMLAAYVLAEIFREGNKLYEEQQFTI